MSGAPLSIKEPIKAISKWCVPPTERLATLAIVSASSGSIFSSFGWFATPMVPAAGDGVAPDPAATPDRELPASAHAPSASGTYPHGPVRGGLFSRCTRALRALDDHWLWDLIGAVLLFGTLWFSLLFAWAATP